LDAKGDAIMAALSSAVDAVAATIAIQQEITEQNEAHSENRRMQFRIGVNLGDVVEEDGTLYGDGVNIAGRLESLAEPGSVCISRNVHEQVEGKLPLDFEYLGEHKVKSETVQAYKVVVPDGVEMPAGNLLPGRSQTHRSRRTRLIAGGIVLLMLVLGGIFAWQQIRMPAETEDPVLALPTGPSIAVLPFENMSGDPEQEYFSDGLTEDIITRLSRFPRFFVIARNSTYQYKGRAVDVREVGRDLGARYVVEGSVRRSGETIRVTIQLLDAEDGTHLWAETYDRDLTAANLFDIQDEITDRVSAAIADERGILWQAGATGVREKPTNDLDAYECWLRYVSYSSIQTPSEHLEVRECAERAVETDPNYAGAWIALGYSSLDEVRFGFNPQPGSLDRALEAARRAVQLDGDDALARELLALVYFHQHDLDAFRSEGERAIALNPNNSWVLANIGTYLVWTGELDRGSAMVKKAAALNPNHPGWYFLSLSFTEYQKKNYDKALDYALKINTPGFHWAQIHLAVAYGQLGRTAEGRATIDKLLENYPDFAENAWDEYRKYNVPDELIRRELDGLRKAGLDVPDGPPANEVNKPRS
jgi:adenylate cyclase